jgi:Chaperone of endosialidase
MKKMILKKIPAFNAILRNSVDRRCLRCGLLLGTLLFACVGLLPTAQAVSPTPDGVYPGANCAEGGESALHLLTTGQNNTAIGVQSLFNDTEGSFNTGLGYSSLFSNATGVANTALGNSALQNTRFISGFFGGSLNTAVGFNAALQNTNGAANIAIGFDALPNNTTGSVNIAIGLLAGAAIDGENGNICIGNVSGVSGQDNRTYIDNIWQTGQSFNPGTNNYVTVRSDGRLGQTTIVSSRRYKEDIKPMGKVSEAVLALKPVSFRLKKEIDDAQLPGFGLIAEDVEKVDPSLVYHNKKGEPESVRYDAVNAMLLNEFLKEHNTVQELKKEIRALTATVKEQAAQIQKVSAELELNKPAPQTVLNNQ